MACSALARARSLPAPAVIAGMTGASVAQQRGVRERYADLDAMRHAGPIGIAQQLVAQIMGRFKRANPADIAARIGIQRRADTIVARAAGADPRAPLPDPAACPVRREETGRGAADRRPAQLREYSRRPAAFGWFSQKPGARARSIIRERRPSPGMAASGPSTAPPSGQIVEARIAGQKLRRHRCPRAQP